MLLYIAAIYSSHRFSRICKLSVLSTVALYPEIRIILILRLVYSFNSSIPSIISLCFICQIKVISWCHVLFLYKATKKFLLKIVNIIFVCRLVSILNLSALSFFISCSFHCHTMSRVISYYTRKISLVPWQSLLSRR